MDEGGWLGGVQEQLPVNRQGRSYSQSFAGAVVDFIGDGVQLLLAVARQVGAFGQVLAHQAVGVLVAASLPWAVRVAKVHGHAGVDGQLFVQRHLFALVIGERLAHGLGNGTQLVREGLQHMGRAGGLGMRQFDQHEQSAGALDQSAHGTGIALALDEVAFPVARKLSVLGLWRAHMDAEHVRNLPTPVLAFAAWRSFVAGLVQVGNQFLAQLAHRLGVDAVVDGFV